MRVLHVGNLYPPHDHGGGAELIWRSAVLALRAAGHECRVLTTTERTPGIGDGAEPDVHRALPWYWRDHAFPERATRAELAIERESTRTVTAHLDAFRPDVLAWWSLGGMALSPIQSAHDRGLPSAAFVLDDWLDYGRRADAWHVRRERLGPAGRWLARRAGVPERVDLATATHYAWISRFVREHARTTGLPGLPDGTILHSGIDDAHLAPTPLPGWSWRLLYVGRVDRRKGVETAVRALAELPPEARLRIVGRGDPESVERVERTARELGLRDRVELTGVRSRDELPALYGAADAVLFPSEWQEPWGLVPLEAMAFGRPVVATGTGGSAEYLREGENALLFPAGDAGALAGRLRELAADAGLRERLRAGGLATAPAFTESAYNAGVEATLRAQLPG
jgi:glycosyltransferase involved in cell wall biosynthesis